MNGVVPRIVATGTKVFVRWPGDELWTTVARQPNGRDLLGFTPQLPVGAVELHVESEERVK